MRGFKRGRLSTCGAFAVTALLLSAFGLVISSCNRPGGWEPWGGSAGTPHEQTTRPGGANSDANDATGWSLFGRSRGSLRDSGLRVVQLGFEVVRIDLPVQSVRHSRKIWNHVDELRIEPELVARLARNGMRLGAVSREGWPAIDAILDAAGAQSSTQRMPPQMQAPLIIEVAKVAPRESIFRYDEADRLVGKTFAGGRKILTVDYAYHPELGGATSLRVRLEIRRELGTMTWEQRDGVIRQVPAVDRHEFSELTARLMLNPGESLLIGPSEKADNAYLVGSRFFSGDRDGTPSETLMRITPILFNEREPGARRN